MSAADNSNINFEVLVISRGSLPPAGEAIRHST
jgi:hypothetical protein